MEDSFRKASHAVSHVHIGSHASVNGNSSNLTVSSHSFSQILSFAKIWIPLFESFPPRWKRRKSALWRFTCNLFASRIRKTKHFSAIFISFNFNSQRDTCIFYLSIEIVNIAHISLILAFAISGFAKNHIRLLIFWANGGRIKAAGVAIFPAFLPSCFRKRQTLRMYIVQFLQK